MMYAEYFKVPNEMLEHPHLIKSMASPDKKIYYNGMSFSKIKEVKSGQDGSDLENNLTTFIFIRDVFKAPRIAIGSHIIRRMRL